MREVDALIFETHLNRNINLHVWFQV